MNRVLLAAVALAAFPLGLPAEEPAIHLMVRPMAAPKPALKYQLLPEVRELNPGNPAQNYLKCFMEQQNFFFSKGAASERASYLSMPLVELPADKLRQYGGVALTQADWAARLDTPDWQILQRLQTDGLDMLVPEVGQLRILAEALQVRFRAQVAGRHFDEAVTTAKTMFALARHLGEHPTETANLIGLSVAEQTLDTLEEMVQQPDSPNLYWALTDLPCPLVDLRKGLQGNRSLVAADLRLPQEEPMTEAQVEKVVSRLSGVMSFARQQAGAAPRGLRTALEAQVKDPEKLHAARNRLVEEGWKEELVRKFPPVQVILLDEKRAFEVRRDERLKLLGLTPWQIDALVGGEKSGSEADGLFADLLPDILKARRAQGRLEQRVALLRHVEALRLYAAAHDGKLPEKLAEVAVPLPDDPFTGKPFAYQVEAATAHLRGSSPRGEEKSPGFNIHYAVTLQK
jgi:hypothetical protein